MSAMDSSGRQSGVQAHQHHQSMLSPARTQVLQVLATHSCGMATKHVFTRYLGTTRYVKVIAAVPGLISRPCCRKTLASFLCMTNQFPWYLICKMSLKRCFNPNCVYIWYPHTMVHDAGCETRFTVVCAKGLAFAACS